MIDALHNLSKTLLEPLVKPEDLHLIMALFGDDIYKVIQDKLPQSLGDLCAVLEQAEGVTLNPFEDFLDTILNITACIVRAHIMRTHNHVPDPQELLSMYGLNYCR